MLVMMIITKIIIMIMAKEKRKAGEKKERNLLADISRKERSSVTLFCPLKNVLML